MYHCDDDVFRRRFVDEFPASQTRDGICQGFMSLRASAEPIGVAALQWVDGSFVEAKQDPADVDVVSFADYQTLNVLAPHAQGQVMQLLAGGESTKTPYATHTFLVAVYPPGHPNFSRFERARRGWRKWWGTTREVPSLPGPDLPGRRKGFVSMQLGDASRVPVVSGERSDP